MSRRKHEHNQLIMQSLETTRTDIFVPKTKRDTKDKQSTYSINLIDYKPMMSSARNGRALSWACAAHHCTALHNLSTNTETLANTHTHQKKTKNKNTIFKFIHDHRQHQRNPNNTDTSTKAFPCSHNRHSLVVMPTPWPCYESHETLRLVSDGPIP